MSSPKASPYNYFNITYICMCLDILCFLRYEISLENINLHHQASNVISPFDCFGHIQEEHAPQRISKIKGVKDDESNIIDKEKQKTIQTNEELVSSSSLEDEELGITLQNSRLF